MLSHCGLTLKAMEYLGPGLGANQRLNLLDLSGNHAIGGKGAAVLASSLLINGALAELSLRDCDVDEEGESV